MRAYRMIGSFWGLMLIAGSAVAGDNKALLDPNRTVGVEAYPSKSDVDIYELIDDAGTADEHDGADAVVIFDRTETIVEDSGLGHVTRRRLFKVLTEKGAARLASLRFDWDPASNYVELKKALVHREGKVATTLGPDRLLDLPQPQRYIYWGARMKLLAVGRLRVGDALEVETYEKGFRIAYLDDVSGASPAAGIQAGGDEKYIPPMRGHFYAVPVFGDQPFKVLEQRYVAKLNKNKPLQYQILNGDVNSEVTFEGDSIVYDFWKNDLAPFEREPVSPWPTDTLPKVVMATVPDWEAKSSWFYEVNEQQFDSTPGIKAKVAQITRGKTGDERIAALLHWVAQEIRYSGITMGKGEGYTLHSGEMTFNDRAGVCKDIAGMLVTMLRADGHTVYPAMTMAGSRVEKVPADQFNHCVVALKQPDGSFHMLDPTWAPFSQELWSNAERQQHFVVGTPEGDTLREIPALPAEANLLAIVGETELGETGDLKGRLTLTGHGYLETRMRYHVVFRAAAELRHQLRRWLAVLSPTSSLESYTMTDIRDLDRDFAIRMNFKAPGYAAAGEGLLTLKMPLARHLVQTKRLGWFLSTAEAEERKSDILFRSTEARVYRERLKLPAGYRLVGGPRRDRVESKIADFEARLEQVGNSLELTERIRVHQRRISPKQYPEYRRVMEAAKAFGERLLFVEKRTAAARAPKGGAR